MSEPPQPPFLLGLGAIAVDDILYLDAHPAPDSKMPVRSRRREGGGLCATALVAAQRLGVSTSFVGVLGEDELSRFSRDALQRESVNCEHIIAREGAKPRYSVILVSQADGGRCILSSKADIVPLTEDDVRSEWLDGCGALFVDHTEAVAGLILAQMARERSIPVVVDIERADEPSILDLLRTVSHPILSLDFARNLTEQTTPSAVLLAMEADFCPNAEMLCLTDGANGCHVLHGSLEHIPAFRVAAVDTTGCGDAFHGAFAASLIQGFDTRTSLVRATACAALNATQPGGRGGLPTRDALQDFLTNNC